MKRRVKWLAHDLKARQPLREGKAYNFLYLRPRVLAFAAHMGSWGQPCQAEGKEVDVGAPPNQDPGKTPFPGKGLAHATRKHVCFHMDLEWEGIWTTGLI